MASSLVKRGAATMLVLGLAGCQASDSQGPNGTSLLPGQSAGAAGATTLQLHGGTDGSEHVLVLVDTALTGAATSVPYQVAATSIALPGSVMAPATSRAPEPRAAPGGAEPNRASRLDLGYGMRLNERSHPRLLGGFRAARAAATASATAGSRAQFSRALIDPAIGDLVRVNVGTQACDAPINRAARVVAVGTRSIVLSDTLNPSGGFSAADFQRFASRFDTLVYPLNVSNFGAPGDIDQNQKIVMLFTSAVNELTPRNSASYVGGFFFDRDLFPVTDTPGFQGCGTSNFGELFYLLAPDPSGSVNGNVRRTGFVDSVTTSVIAHEFQHLINSSRRLFVTGANDFEEVWLNEGLSHIAEELLFYREAKLAPRANLGVSALRENATARNAYNVDMSSNTSRYSSFLEAPSQFSLIQLDDSLATRGAAWNFLRYAADRKMGTGTNESPIWQALSGANREGVANLAAVFGPDVAGWIHDWAISHYTDDAVPGVAREFTQPSWNFHSIYPALGDGGNSYPLKVLPLQPSATSGSLIGGSAAYYRFAIPAGATATITVTASPVIAARVVRVR